MIRRPPRSTRTDTLFPYTTLFRSCNASVAVREGWLKKNPNDVPMLLAAGQAYTQLNRYDDATAAYRRVHALAPSNVVALNNLAWLLQKSEPDEALRHAERANQHAPGAPWSLVNLGWLDRRGVG